MLIHQKVVCTIKHMIYLQLCTIVVGICSVSDNNKTSPKRIRNTQQQNIPLPTKGDPEKEMSTIFTLDLFKRMVIVW